MGAGRAAARFTPSLSYKTASSDVTSKSRVLLFIFLYPVSLCYHPLQNRRIDDVHFGERIEEIRQHEGRTAEEAKTHRRKRQQRGKTQGVIYTNRQIEGGLYGRAETFRGITC